MMDTAADYRTVEQGRETANVITARREAFERRRTRDVQRAIGPLRTLKRTKVRKKKKQNASRFDDAGSHTSTS
jgi:hypothetical protein